MNDRVESRGKIMPEQIQIDALTKNPRQNSGINPAISMYNRDSGAGISGQANVSVGQSALRVSGSRVANVV